MTVHQMLVLAICGGLLGGVVWSAFGACADALSRWLHSMDERDARIDAARMRSAQLGEGGARFAGADLPNGSHKHG
jgi:hypothetical protein